MIDRLYRRTLLGLASSGGVRSAAERLGPRLGVKRFVAGTTLAEALPAVRTLQQSGLLVILDLLGEYVEDAGAAATIAAEIAAALDALADEATPPTLSVKPTQLGLAIDDDLAFEHASSLLERAAAVGTSICLDMENAVYVERTLTLFERLRGAGHANVVTVLQSYLYRTPDDLERLLALAPDLELRIVKGAYKETPDVAHQERSQVERAFRDLVYRGLEAGAKIDVATHDERLLAEVAAYIRGAGLGADRYELQLLYGVRTQLQRRLAEEHPVRIYVPFGRDWYGYFSRRLAERPANLAFVLRGLVG
jgi:proline dehydrogenase